MSLLKEQLRKDLEEIIGWEQAEILSHYLAQNIKDRTVHRHVYIEGLLGVGEEPTFHVEATSLSLTEAQDFIKKHARSELRWWSPSSAQESSGDLWKITINNTNEGKRRIYGS